MSWKNNNAQIIIARTRYIGIVRGRDAVMKKYTRFGSECIFLLILIPYSSIP